MKKIISLVLTFVLVLSCVPAGAIFAYATQTYTNPTIYVESTQAYVGTTVDVKVHLVNNPGIAGAVIEIDYAPGLTLTGAVSGDTFSALTFLHSTKLTSPCKFSWDSEHEQIDKDGVLLNLTFDVASGIKPGEKLDIKLSCRNGDIYNSALETVAFDTVSGNVTVFDYMPGDVTGDKVVNGKDVTTLRRYIVGDDIKLNLHAANVNGDDIINGKDVTMIRRYIVGDNVELLPDREIQEHNMKEFPAKTATCTEDGNIAYWQCLKCSKYFKDADGIQEINIEDTIIPAKGHTIEIIKGYPPKDGKPGLTDGKRCSVCGIIIKKQEVIPVPAEDKYTIEYHIDDNDNYLQSLNIKNDNPITFSPEKSYTLSSLDVDGYIFEGWYDGAGKNSVQIKEIPKGTDHNIKLYAHWSLVPYDIIFDSPDVPVPSVKYTVNSGQTLVSPKHFGYIFVGWSLNDRLVNRIPEGTTGNLTLHANWTSQRNRAVIEPLQKPDVIEDVENAQYLFLFRLGKIENVPLALIPGTEASYVPEINIESTYTCDYIVDQNYASTAAKAVANATTKSSSWTLSEEWNESTSTENESEEAFSKTSGYEDRYGEKHAGEYYIGNNMAGTTTDTEKMGGSSNVSAKVTKSDSVGIKGTYGIEHQIGMSADLNVNSKLGNGIGAEVGIPGGKLTGNLNSEISVGLDVGVNESVKKSLQVSEERKHETTSENSYGEEEHWDSSRTSGKSWNKDQSYKSSHESTRDSKVSQEISNTISNRHKVSSMVNRSQENSTTTSADESTSVKNEYSTTMEYSTEKRKSSTFNLSFSSNEPGWYRLVQSGTVYVYAVVGYDIATGSYYSYTYNVLDKDRKISLDYSTNSSFNDCENSVLPFSVPFYVHEFIESKMASSQGLKIRSSEDNKSAYISQYTGESKYVVIPEYFSVDNHNGTYSAQKVTSIDKDAFRNNINVEGIIFPKYINKIPDNAFEGCTSLKYVLYDGVYEIGKDAFKGCSSLLPFYVDKHISILGENSFCNVNEVKVDACNSEIADKTIASRAKNIVLNISKIDYNNKKVLIPNTTDSFTLIGEGKEYSDLTIESNAGYTFITDIKFVDNQETPLVISSPKVTLNQVSVINSPGFGLILSNENTTLELFKTNNLDSSDKNVVLCKNITLKEQDKNVEGILSLTGNLLVCGNVTDEHNMLSFKNPEHKIIYISADEYENYRNVRTVTFDPVGGYFENAEMARKEIPYNAKYGQLPVPKRDYYNFEGWFTETAGGIKITEDSKCTSSTNQTLYAHWTEKPVSGWIKKSEMPAGSKILEQKWSYTKTTNFESRNTSEPGCTQTGSRWVESGRGSQNYSTEFHPGFDQGHWIYQQFAKGPLYGYENATNKRVVSDRWGGFVYWHWMYDCGAYRDHTERTISPYSGNWNPSGGHSGANTYNYKFFYAMTSTVDCPYLSNTYCCSQKMGSYNCVNILPGDKGRIGTPRFFRFNYRVSDYIDYYKMFSYSKSENLESTKEISNGGNISNVQEWVKFREK